jgi:hypothetical protein
MSDIEMITGLLTKGPHSFNHIRDKSKLKWTDEKFRAFIAQHPGVLEETKLVKKDAKGKRVRPGWPGVRMRKAAAG